VARRSTHAALYEPRDAGDWDERAARLHTLRLHT